MPTLEQKLANFIESIPSNKPLVSLQDKAYSQQGVARLIATKGRLTEFPDYQTAILDFDSQLRNPLDRRLVLQASTSMTGRSIIKAFLEFTQTIGLGFALVNDPLAEEIQIIERYNILNPQEPPIAYRYRNEYEGRLTLKLTNEVPKFGIYPTELIVEGFILAQLNRQINLKKEANLIPIFTVSRLGRPPKPKPLSNP